MFHRVPPLWSALWTWSKNLPSEITLKKTAENFRPRVLVLAEAANPEWVSVPLLGWSLSQALKTVADVHLVTQVRNRDALCRAGLVEGDDFTAIDTESVARPMNRLAALFGGNRAWTIRTALDRLPYMQFERKVWKHFGPALARGEFDIVHRVTPVSPSINSSMASRCRKIGVPFVLGPINGGVPWPKGFEAEQKQEREWLSKVRGLYKFAPARRRMLRDSRVILAGSGFAEAEIPETYRHKTIRFAENGVDLERFSGVADAYTDGPLRACFIGRLVPLKGVDMLLHAAADLMRQGKLIIDIIGDGPMREPLEKLAQELNVTNQIKFHGMLPHNEVAPVACKSQLMIFPSIREFGGGVVLEAMALGLVPVVIDYAGPAELVDEAVGFKVPIGPRDEIIAGLRSVLGQIAGNPQMLEPLAKGARNRVETFYLWNQKAKQLNEVYGWALGHRPDLPNLSAAAVETPDA